MSELQKIQRRILRKRNGKTRLMMWTGKENGLRRSRRLCRKLTLCKNAIGKAVVSARMQQRAERLEFDMRTGGDSTARLAIQAVTPLAAVRCIYLGQAFLVYQPEKWLDVIERSLLLFRQRFGDKSYKAIQHRYVYHWTVRKISVIDEISPQVYALRRRSFIDGLLMLAIQEGLIRIDINANSFQKARAEQKKEG